MDNLAWILVADGSQARIFSAHKAALFNGNEDKLKLIKEFEHKESRKKDSELVTDRHGHFGSGTFVDHTDPQAHEEEVFATRLAKDLIKAHSENQYRELIFIAPAHFIGLLKKHLPDEIERLASLRIEKDYTKLAEKELVQRMQDYL